MVFKNPDDKETSPAVEEFDTLIHTFGKGAMKIWVILVVRDITGQGPDAGNPRRRGEQDKERGNYTINDETFIDAEVMSPVTLCNYKLQKLLIISNSQTGTLVDRFAFLLQQVVIGYPESDHCP